MKRRFFNPKTISDDLSAGLVLGIESIPDGMASGLLASVNPIYGLYGYMTGVFTGAFFTSSVFMSVQATGAMALVVASVPQVVSGEDPNTALFALSILTGLVMLVAGLLKLGSLVRFVPNSVMVGFINAVAILIILGQLDDFTGYSSTGGNKIVKTLDLFLNLDQINLQTLMIGLVTIILILTLEKTSLKALGMVVALGVASLMVPLTGWDSVALVRDMADIPSSLPRPMLPPLSVFPGLIIPAFSLAFVGLMQGASISQSVPNPDGDYPDASGDFVGQGVANLVAGLFQGTPVGGSMSATSIVTNAGARSRLANIFAGIVMAITILLFGKFVGAIAMPALAGLLIVVGFRTLKAHAARTVWRTGLVQQLVMMLTFVAALLIPLQYAVLMGVALAVVLFVLKQSNKITVVAWDWEPGQLPVESEPPEVVPANEVTILVPFGSLFFAAAPLFEAQLPQVEDDSRHAVVIIVLHGETEVGSTLLEVITRYADTLRTNESRLMLASIDPHVKEQITRTKVIQSIGLKNIFMATDIVGESVMEAAHEAEAWIGTISENKDEPG